MSTDPLKHRITMLRYRPWRGELRGPWSAVLAIARVSLGQMFRRKLFWGLFGVSALIFLFFFFGQYLGVFLQTQLTGETGTVRLGTGATALTVRPESLIQWLTKSLKMNGTADTFANFIWYEGFILIIVLTLAGSVLIGNDFSHGSMPFYLSKPISRWHYMLGKCLAIGVFVNLMTTVPALLLFLQYGMVDEWSYYWDSFHLVIGILGYGLILTVSLSIILLAFATWLRKTVPMIMVWVSVFVLGRIVAKLIVDGLKFSPSWRLLDLWNDMYLMGASCLGIPLDTMRPGPQPPFWQAWLVIGGLCAFCLLYLRRQIQAVEVVS